MIRVEDIVPVKGMKLPRAYLLCRPLREARVGVLELPRNAKAPIAFLLVCGYGPDAENHDGRIVLAASFAGMTVRYKSVSYLLLNEESDIRGSLDYESEAFNYVRENYEVMDAE